MSLFPIGLKKQSRFDGLQSSDKVQVRPSSGLVSGNGNFAGEIEFRVQGGSNSILNLKESYFLLRSKWFDLADGADATTAPTLQRVPLSGAQAAATYSSVIPSQAWVSQLFDSVRVYYGDVLVSEVVNPGESDWLSTLSSSNREFFEVSSCLSFHDLDNLGPPPNNEEFNARQSIARGADGAQTETVWKLPTGLFNGIDAIPGVGTWRIVLQVSDQWFNRVARWNLSNMFTASAATRQNFAGHLNDLKNTPANFPIQIDDLSLYVHQTLPVIPKKISGVHRYSMTSVRTIVQNTGNAASDHLRFEIPGQTTLALIAFQDPQLQGGFGSITDVQGAGLISAELSAVECIPAYIRSLRIQFDGLVRPSPQYSNISFETQDKVSRPYIDFMQATRGTGFDYQGGQMTIEEYCKRPMFAFTLTRPEDSTSTLLEVDIERTANTTTGQTDFPTLRAICVCWYNQDMVAEYSANDLVSVRME